MAFPFIRLRRHAIEFIKVNLEPVVNSAAHKMHFCRWALPSDDEDAVLETPSTVEPETVADQQLQPALRHGIPGSVIADSVESDEDDAERRAFEDGNPGMDVMRSLDYTPGAGAPLST